MQSFGELLGEEICEEREARGWTQVQLALKAFGDEDAVRRIHNYEKGKVANPQARTYQPICEALGITRPRIKALKAQASNAATLNDDEVGSLRAAKGSLQEALDDSRSLTRSQLVALAEMFDHDTPGETPDDMLAEYLNRKAEDYRALRAEIEGIDEGLKRLSNLKAAAFAAIEDGDLEKVEVLLERVQEVELEEAAKTAELRADNALLRGKTEQAFRILSAAADSFGAVDALEPVRRQNTYAAKFYFHGLRYGGSGLQRAAEMWQTCADRATELNTGELAAAARSNLGAALRNQGTRTGGAAGAALLAEAITAYRATLEVYARAAHPVDWAMTQNNLAIALQEQGTRTGGAAGAALLAEAVAAYRAALAVRTRDPHPVDWAMTQNNLGNALQEQGTRTGGAAGAALLAEAVTAYRAALEVYTRDAHPVHWATTQNNLGTALQEQGTRTDEAAGAALLAEAVTAYRAALEVRTRDAHPVHWAETQNNLGTALQDQGTRTGAAASAALLAEAVTAFRAALEVYTREAHPVNWAMTQQNMALAEEARADRETCADPLPQLRAAHAHVDAALEVFDPEHMPYHFEQARDLMARLEARMAGLG